MNWNIVFYSFSIGGFCLNFAYEMPYSFDITTIVNALIKSGLMGIGLGSLMVGVFYAWESYNTSEERRPER